MLVVHRRAAGLSGLNTIRYGMPSDDAFRYKQCLLIRADLKISCGKRCAQAAHAAVMAYEHAGKEERRAWLAEGQKKVVLKAPSLQVLYELKTLAEYQGIATALIQDAGMTEVEPGTITALGLGPARSELLDRVTGGLALL